MATTDTIVTGGTMAIIGMDGITDIIGIGATTATTDTEGTIATAGIGTSPHFLPPFVARRCKGAARVAFATGERAGK